MIRMHGESASATLDWVCSFHFLYKEKNKPTSAVVDIKKKNNYVCTFSEKICYIRFSYRLEVSYRGRNHKFEERPAVLRGDNLQGKKLIN